MGTTLHSTTRSGAGGQVANGGGRPAHRPPPRVRWPGVAHPGVLGYDTYILGLEHQFPRDVESVERPSVEAELAAVRGSMQAIGSTLEACRSALLELQLQLTQLERQLSRLEATRQLGGTSDRSRLGSLSEGVVELPRDDVVDRVDRLRLACEAMLKRPLRTSERPIVLRWAQLERGGELVGVEEIVHVAGRLLTRRTPEGTLPNSLGWCDATVQTLARGAAGPTPPRGMDAAAEFAALYEKLADRLDAQQGGATDGPASGPGPT